MLPDDLSLVAAVMLDGTWHHPVPGTLKREGSLLTWREGHNPAAHEVVTDVECVSAVLIDSKRKAMAEDAAKASRAERLKVASAPVVFGNISVEVASRPQDEAQKDEANATARPKKGGR